MKRMAKGSARQACMLHLTQSRFIVRNRDGESAVIGVTSDESIPTEMVERTERFGGLHYADAKCWKFFAIVEYSFSKTATVDNFICCAGSVLREISAALLSNVQLGKLFAELCDLTATSLYDFSDTTTCLQFFLLVFGRVRAKDLSLKYNSKLYKGKNATSLRSSLAAHTGKNKNEKKKNNHDEMNECMDELNEELDITKKVSQRESQRDL